MVELDGQPCVIGEKMNFQRSPSHPSNRFERSRDESLLKAIAGEVRRNVIRMTAAAGSGHPGGSLSIADIITALYIGEMNHRPDDPCWPDRDRLHLSKGHACPALYAILAETGYFPTEELLSLRKINSRLQGHPDYRLTPGVDMSSGSLGQGLSVANGMALAGRLDGKKYRVYVIMGDGELQEGQIWEAALSSRNYALDNLCAILDFNGLQIDGPVREVKDVSPLKEKWEAFGWHVIEIDGHSFTEIFSALDEARGIGGRPTIIIAKTVKGKGVSFMENKVEFHGKPPTPEEARRALIELGAAEEPGLFTGDV
jgi:transketolase